MHDIIKASIFAAIGVLVFASLLVPVVSDAMTDNGEPITLTNNSNVVLKSISDGDVFKLVSTYNNNAKTDVWTINDQVITSVGGGTLGWDVGLISDCMYVRILSSGNAASATTALMTNVSGGEQYISPAQTDGVYTWTWVFANGEMTYTDRYGTVVNAPYTWGYVACPLEDGEYYSAETNGVGYCKTANDLILCGSYTSGELDTMYYYHNGAGYVSNPNYTMTVNAELEKHQGTTDIYDITTSVVMSDGTNDETFTPYRIYLPYQVTGHQTSGALYDMLGVLPIAVIVVLIFGVLGAALYSRIE